VRLVPLILVCVLIGAIAASASEPITLYSGKAHAWVIKFSNDAEKDLAKGDLGGARHNIAESLRYDPAYWPVLYTRAKLFSRERKWDAVRRDCDEIMRQASTFVPAALLRAQANINLGNYAAASKEMDHVISIEPIPQYYAMAFNQRALFRAICPNPSFRNPHGAVEDAKRACSVTQWREAEPIDTLAIACAEAGDFDSAVRYLEKAMQAYDAAELGKTLPAHLNLFKQHRRLTAP
jgi:tetratricopeptide (TPR) repeat protein